MKIHNAICQVCQTSRDLLTPNSTKWGDTFTVHCHTCNTQTVHTIGVSTPRFKFVNELKGGLPIDDCVQAAVGLSSSSGLPTLGESERQEAVSLLARHGNSLAFQQEVMEEVNKASPKGIRPTVGPNGEVIS